MRKPEERGEEMREQSAKEYLNSVIWQGGGAVIWGAELGAMIYGAEVGAVVGIS